MKSFFITLLLTHFILFEAKAQKTQAEYKSQYQNHWTGANFVDALDTLAAKGKLKFIKKLQSKDLMILKTAILGMDADALTKGNLLSEYFCTMKHEESFQKWNRLYTRLSRKTFDTYCMALMFVMTLDGTLNDE
jgi:hypothetical protein